MPNAPAYNKELDHHVLRAMKILPTEVQKQIEQGVKQGLLADPLFRNRVADLLDAPAKKYPGGFEALQRHHAQLAQDIAAIRGVIAKIQSTPHTEEEVAMQKQLDALTLKEMDIEIHGLQTDVSRITTGVMKKDEAHADAQTGKDEEMARLRAELLNPPAKPSQR